MVVYLLSKPLMTHFVMWGPSLIPGKGRFEGLNLQPKRAIANCWCQWRTETRSDSACS